MSTAYYLFRPSHKRCHRQERIDQLLSQGMVGGGGGERKIQANEVKATPSAKTKKGGTGVGKGTVGHGGRERFRVLVSARPLL